MNAPPPPQWQGGWFQRRGAKGLSAIVKHEGFRVQGPTVSGV